jgi:mannosylglycerate hydrolase
MNTIHLISHTHWDREWYLPFQQFRRKFIHLLDKVLEMLENDPEYKYFLLDGQTILLEDYLQINPGMEPAISKYIKAGRLLIGPWYISPDEFLVAPESHIRNLLEGDKLCQKYGNKMMIGYLPDTFGHIGQMPQILRGFGIDAACLWRGLDDQPTELVWKAPDGSIVLLAYLRDSYSNAANLSLSDPLKFTSEINERIQSLLPYSQSGHILLMHGTDHMEPYPGLSQSSHSYNINSEANNLIHSNLPEYFEGIRSYLNSTSKVFPEVHGELRSSKQSPLLQNVLSTHITIKQRNHSCENDLLKWIEPFSTWGFLQESTRNIHGAASNKLDHFLDNPKSIIRYSWKLLMQCHPHDSICATSIDQVIKEIYIRFDQVDQINDDLIKQSLRYLCDQIDTVPGAGKNNYRNSQDIIASMIVFNSTNAESNGIITIKYSLNKPYSFIEVIDQADHRIPFQQKGLGKRELISMVMAKNDLKLALGMIHEGRVTGMIIRDYVLEVRESKAIIQVTLSDHGNVDIERWKDGLQRIEAILEDPEINEYIVKAYSDPEIYLSILAKDVPAHGYRPYWIRGIPHLLDETTQPSKLNPFIKPLLPIINHLSQYPIFNKSFGKSKTRLSQHTHKIENEFFFVVADTSAGTLIITDKRTTQVYSGLNRFLDGGDCGDLYNFCPPKFDLQIEAKVRSIISDISDIYQKLVVNYELLIPESISEDRTSRNQQKIKNMIESEITLIPGVPRIDICTRIDNRASDHRLRVHFPVPFVTETAWHDGHYEIVERQIANPPYDVSWTEPSRPEKPQREFTTVTNGKISLTIANRGLPEVEVLQNETNQTEIALTLLRCVGWLSRDDISTRKGHAGPMDIPTPAAQMLGKHTFYYSIIPNGGNWHPSIQQAYAFNVPMRAIDTTIHSGTLPSISSMIINKNSDFIITTIKQAETVSGFIVRGFNTLSNPIDVSIVPWRPFPNAQLVNLDEKVIKNIPTSHDGMVNIKVEGHKICTMRFFD